MSRFEYTIENVLDIPLWEKMQDRLAELTGTAIVCIDIKGKPVTKHSGRTAFCSIVRENPVSRKRCFRCDALAGVEAVRRGRPYIYLCHCGIVDVAVPVMVGDIYLGAVMFGQVRLRHKDREKAERLVNEISSILPQEDAAQQEILRKHELLPEMDYDRIVQVAEYINDMVHYIVDRAVKSHTRDETYKWLMSANAEQPSEEIQIQELLPQEEHRPQQTGMLPVNPRQENGSHYDCDYASLASDRAVLTAVGEKTFSFQASIYTQEELTAKAHNYELRPCGSTVFCIDYRQAGIGSASCGPMLLEKYQLKETEISFDVRLKPELL